MKRLIWPGIICTLLLVTALLPGCSRLSYVAGKGNIIDDQYHFSDFNAIDVGSNIEIEIDPLNIYTISVRTYENLFDYLDISQSGKTLKIRLKPIISYHNLNMKATITLPELRDLTLSGGSHGSAKGFKSAQDFNLTESGASSLDIDIESGSSHIKLSGSSQVTGHLISADSRLEVSSGSRADLNGSANNLALESSGEGVANLLNLNVQNAGITLSGDSHANLTLTGKLDADLSGGSSLFYAGSPSLGKTNVTGNSILTHQ